MFGRDETAITATVRADGRARLEFGSGEEFVGPYDEMPLSVTRGAKKLLEAAGSWSRSRGSRPFRDRESGLVRIAVRNDDETREFRAGLDELRDVDGAAHALWDAFISWLRPFLVVLFGDTPGGRAAGESPALSRARALCRQVRSGSPVS